MSKIQPGLMSHIAMSVDAATFNETYIDDLTFYAELLDWQIDPNLSNEDRLLMKLPGNGQYINIKKRERPMTTTDYEHLGIYVESEDQVHELYKQVRAKQQSDDRVELDPRGVQTLYKGILTTFRFKYLLPLAIEVQHLKAR